MVVSPTESFDVTNRFVGFTTDRMVGENDRVVGFTESLVSPT